MTVVESEIVTGVCHHDCPDSCVWEVTVDRAAAEGPRAVKIRGKADHPFTRGELCPKVNPFLDRVYHPDRLLTPMIRTGAKGEGRFERVSWTDALDRISSRLGDVISSHGASAVLPYSYAGNQGVLQCAAMSERFFNRMGASQVVGGLCGNTANAGIVATLGSGIGIDPEDLRHAQVILLWSTNTLITNRHLWPFIEAARANGATVVCIDPLRTRTADHVDWHVQLMPGTDAALALGMMHVLIARGLIDDDYVRDHTTGFDELRERVAIWTPEHTAAICGLDANDIVRLAVLYGSGRPAAIRVLIGMEHREHGAMAYRNIACLPSLIGAWRHRGGGMVRSTGPLFEQVLPGSAIYRPDLISAPRRAVEMGRLGEVLAQPPGPDHVAALMIFNCNPAAITPNQAGVLAGLRREDLFTVAIEQFVTDSARFADVLLPATTQIEHLDLMAPWGHLYLTLNLPAIPPVGEALANTEIFRRLAVAMGYDDDALRAGDEQMIREILEASTHPFIDGITYERLVSHGSIRLAVPDAYLPYADGEFPTASGRTEFFSPALAKMGLDPLPAWVPAREGLLGDSVLRSRFPLECITVKRHQRFLNSSHSMLDGHTRAEGRPVAEIHPVDAAARGIADGDLVRITNDRGSIEVSAEVTERVRPRVVTVSFGWSLAASGGVGANIVTNDATTDMGGGTAFHDNLVQVERVRSGQSDTAAAEIRDAWRSIAGIQHDDVIDDVLARHREPHRRYHTAEHVMWVLRHARDLIAAPDDPHSLKTVDADAVLAAAIFHDVVYDPSSSTNEADSAALAAAALATIGWSRERIALVESLIMATAGHDAATPAEEVLLDADLAILGASGEHYRTYVQAVRREYVHIGDEQWCSGRAAVLRSFLDRPRLYATDQMYNRCEAPARANLQDELEALLGQRTATVPEA